MNSAAYLRKIHKTVTFMKMTERIATMSYDNKHQVGAILVKNDFSTIAAIGYNGNHRGGTNERESQDSGMSGFLHAEENVLIKANLARPEDYTMYVTMTPCRMCAKRIVNKEIREVVYLEAYTNGGDIASVFREGGVRCLTLKEKLMTYFVMTDFLPELQAKINALVEAKSDRETLEIELTGLMYVQLGRYFANANVDLSLIGFMLDEDFDFTNVHALVKAYSYMLLDMLYWIS